MHLRRVVIMGLGLAMIRVTLPGSDLVCARHDSGHAHAVVHSGAGHVPAHQHDPPCETPSQADCCHALASCGVSIAVAEESEMIHPILSVDRQQAWAAVLPASRTSGPEPPPPKA
jgi:hypothetical protein